ncbi:metal ABC transporter ATP-binding protein [Actinobaculum sp. 352]|nr:ABC transporter [Actinobaculum sp. 313]RTE48055.1 metal ABC transporter ATP-binding protein [Actinobaculum sp. 352]
MDAAALVVQNLTVHYGAVQALTGVDFTLEPGRVCGLVGMNGSGKSSLLTAIAGTTRSQGEMTVYGEPVRRARRRGMIGFVPQADGVDKDFPVTVDDVVLMGRYGLMGMTRRPRQEDKATVDEALARVELTDLRVRRIGALSGGQRKRVFIARALAQGARLLLLDEPFAGVDKPSEQAMIRLLRSLADEGVAILVATHDLAGLPDLCDETLLLLRRVLFHGPPADALRPETLGQAFGMAAMEGGNA